MSSSSVSKSGSESEDRSSSASNSCVVTGYFLFNSFRVYAVHGSGAAVIVSVLVGNLSFGILLIGVDGILFL